MPPADIRRGKLRRVEDAAYDGQKRLPLLRENDTEQAQWCNDYRQRS